MRKRVPGAKRAGQNATENDGMVSPALAGGGGRARVRPQAVAAYGAFDVGQQRPNA